MSRNREKEVFLATTALEEFWDTSKPIVFLGPWCLLHERKRSWQQLDGQLMPDPFMSEGAAKEAYHQVHACYERILPVLAEALNGLHGQSHSLRYWRIVAGPWLHVYISALFERYLSLKMALAQYPGFDTIVLAESAHVVPASTHDFAAYLIEDTYNLQIYSRLLSALGLKFRQGGGDITQRVQYVKASEPSWKQTAARIASRSYARAASRICRSVLLKDSYFSKSVLASLASSRPGRVLPVLGASGEFSDCPVQPALRDRLQGLPFGDAEFERCIATLLPGDLPKSLVEIYGDIGKAARGNFPKRVTAVFSANAWYYDEVFKQWSAAMAERGAVLLGCQHGGNYGALASMPSEDHETAIVDRYFTWGWKREGRPACVVPMPAPKLIGRGPSADASAKSGMLWVATTMPRYLVQFPWTPGDFKRYLDWQQRFAASLDRNVFRQLRLRPHREDTGWGVAERLRDEFPELQVESWDVSFQQSLDHCALYICDHLSTTFIEALAAGIPTILFWDHGANELRPEAVDSYAQLREAGILFDSPEAAAAAVNAIQHDVAAWWNKPARQRAVATFRARFAHTDADAIAVWQAELDRCIAVLADAQPE
ncbi:LIC12162 family transferase [Massilia putida]|uniref:LIC12162 family transferase n=1 Tax=Massilia putida TaxID=1141883 RepID=UPI000950F2A2|nr:LIC12162 family protein [Massilia putida]